MHDRILAVKHPVIGVGPFDPHAGFVAGDLGFAKDGLRLIGLDLEPRMGADEHVHQRAFADDQAKGVAEQEAQTFVGKRLKALQINRQRMDARSKWRRRGDRGRRSLQRPRHNVRSGRRSVDDGRHRVSPAVSRSRRIPRSIPSRRRATQTRRRTRNALAGDRGTHRDCPPADDCAVHVRLLAPPGREFSRLAFLSVDGGFDEFEMFYPVVEPDHQLNQFVLAQALQISAIHAHMDLEIGLPGKGGAEISGIAFIGRTWRWVIT